MEHNMIYAQHFEAEEFREWADDMSALLITMIAMTVLYVGLTASNIYQFIKGR
jgi:hypothetical protein